MSKTYTAPEDWDPQVLNTEDSVIYFGKHKGKKVSEISKEYLLFMEENGWIKFSAKLHESLTGETLPEEADDIPF